MKTFIIGICILLIGGFFYGKFIEKIFHPDDRETPAIKYNDGIDYLPMNKWKNFMINLLNIAGTGPIFGPIQGILFGPIAFITIPIGCILSGATHDYLCGMISLRQDGSQMPGIVRKFLGNKFYSFYNVFLCFFMLLVGTVFTYTPGDLFLTNILGIKENNIWVWIVYGVILTYYLFATILPIDKIIGKIYPILGGILLFSSIAIFFGIFLKNYQLNELSLKNGFSDIFNMYPLWNVIGNSGEGTPFIPVFFITVACGITSGFHSSQCTIIGRNIRHEKDGLLVFHSSMISEGIIAMIWAAAAMGIYNAGSVSSATNVVGEIAVDILGPFGSIFALFGVIILPITSGDTVLRSCRLMIADYLHIDQRKISNRILITIGIFIPVVIILIFAKTNTSGFNILWRYFSYSNQTIAVITFAAITVYLLNRKDLLKPCCLVALIPGTFYMFITTSFILSQKIGFGLDITVSYIIASIFTLFYVIIIFIQGKNYAKSHIEQKNN